MTADDLGSGMPLRKIGGHLGLSVLFLPSLAAAGLLFFAMGQDAFAQSVQADGSVQNGDAGLNGLNPALAVPPTLPSINALPQTLIDPTTGSEVPSEPGEIADITPVPAPNPQFPLLPNAPPGVTQAAAVAVPRRGVDQTRVGSTTQIQGGTVTPAPPGAFDRLGVRAGKFILRPAIEFGAGYSTNSTNDVTGGASTFATVSPQITAESDWNRHSVNLQAQGNLTQFQSGDDTSDLNLNILANGTYEVDEDTSATLIGLFDLGEDDLTGVADDPLETTIGGTLQLDHQINQIDTRTQFGVARNINNGFVDATGVAVSQDDLNSTLLTANLRGTLRSGAVLQPFLEGEVERELFDEALDEVGNERNVTGLRGFVGVEIDRGEKLNGEIAVGYGRNLVDGNGIEDFGGIAANFAINWSPDRLTNISLVGLTAFDNFPTVATPGDITYDFALVGSRALRENWALTSGAGVIFQVDGGNQDLDTTINANVGLQYTINRLLSVGADYNFTRQFTAGGLADFTANSISLNLRAER